MRKWVLVAAIAGSAAATCYYPDGTDATASFNYRPCGDTNTTYSTCCAFDWGDECLPNGLCHWRGYSDYRAACQNKDWTNCPDVCLGRKSGTWLTLKKCGVNEYCCPSSQDADCCDDGSRTYSLEVPDLKSKSLETQIPSEITSDTMSSEFPTLISKTIAHTSDTTTEPISDGSDKAPVPAGAIIGGVIGGVAVIGILVLGGVYLFKMSPNTTGIVTDIGGSNGPIAGTREQAEPIVGVEQHPGLAMAEGSAPNVYVEADSRPITSTWQGRK
ncbi:hypothetical protein NM208_g7744 [Fusarium decemcellulare]|uniref:Uncharacterized protein n=1 Tax=Fusarium decemcellulare TaxID=57161 RepID=A0ACC1S7Y2_9HYPO|nr:hypothetical protein NM208_g7744 [Fusarium decemcellulare]